MKILDYDVVIIGGGPAGLGAAVKAKENGARVAVIERNDELGGILNQCIHSGFGLQYFKEELTGPEYAELFINKAKEAGIDCYLKTMVLDITEDRKVTAINEEGTVIFNAGAVVLAMGCRERTRGAIKIPGSRPAGVFTAGLAQRYVNMENFKPGSRVVILGSGDIGLIMARRLTLEGAKVKVVAEIMPYSGGLKRNIVQCLDDYGIPLKLSHTVVNIKGQERVEGVTIAQVDENMKPVPGTEEEYSCDTLLLSVGLIPENELSSKMDVGLDRKTNGPIVGESFETNVEGVFACGNVLHVHDLVDYVSEEAAYAGKCAAEYVMKRQKPEPGPVIELVTGEGVSYTVPKTIDLNRMGETLKVRFRVSGVYENSTISVYFDDKCVKHRKKRIVTPGEMEQIELARQDLQAEPDLKQILIKIEEA